MTIKNFLKTTVLGIALLDISNVIASPNIIAQVKYEINNEINESIKKPEFNNPEMNELNSIKNKEANTILDILGKAESEFISSSEYYRVLERLTYFMEENDNAYMSHFNYHDPFINLSQYIINNKNNIKNMLKILKGRIDPNEQW